MSISESQSLTLNNDQKSAVEADAGPVLVVAGAGTGKTSVIVERICRLLRGGTSPKRLLALTFTEKAAAEMAERTSLALDSYYLELPIMTFNAYGESLLRKYAADIGLGRNFTTLSESAQIVFMRERIDELELDYYAPVSRPDGLLSDLASYFSLLKQRVITADAYHEFVRTMLMGDESQKLERKKHQELAGAYKSYIQLCRENNVVDYDDQIFLIIELLKKRPNVLTEIRDSYDYIMVDEFQDTNVMQSMLIDMIVSKNQNLFVVGDDDQSIYGWRGATLSNILSFKDRYHEMKEITLKENYRSGQKILDSAYRLIQHNNPHRLEVRLNIDKRLHGQTEGEQPSVCHFQTLDEELGWIAEDIKRRISDGASPGSIAVLARRNATIDRLRAHLDFAGLDYTVAGQRYELYEDAAVRMLLEAIRAVVDPQDSMSLFHLLTGPLFSLPTQSLSNLSAQARRSHESLFSVIEQSEEEDLQPFRTALSQLTGWREKLSTISVGQLAYEMLETTGYKDTLYQSAASNPAAAVAASRLAELFGAFKEFERIALVPSAVQYIEALPALQAAGDGGEDGGLDLGGISVNVLTIHKAKGLEWSYVYIADCTEGSFPLREGGRGIRLPESLEAKSSSEADAHIAEERRLMYVAMTRAKQELILTYSDKHSSSSTRKPSRFIGEAFGDTAPKEPLCDSRSDTAHLAGFVTQELKAVPLPTSIMKNGQVTLSVSQAESYIKCPLNFYYCYVLNVPQEPSPAQSYGMILHGLIEDMNRSLQSGKLIDYKTLEAQLTAAWPKTGYMSARHRERSFAQASTTLKHVYTQKQIDTRVPLAVEEPFRFAIKEAGLTITGRFDAVFPLGDGVEIVDYKTSASVDTPEKAKSRASSSDQLTLYALAWQRLHDELPALVSLDFIDTGQKGSLKKTQRGIIGMEQKLLHAAEGLRNMKFPPGKDHLFCLHPPTDS